ncbi:MAG: DUF6120 family protein [Eubacterium sp.]
MNREIKKYINQVKGYMLCDGSTKRKCMKDLKSDIQDYIDTEGTQDIEKIKARFGAPEQIAKAFLMEMDIKKIKKKLDIRRAVIAVAVSIVLIWGIGVTIAVVDGIKDGSGYFDEEVITVIKEEDEV